MKIGDVVYAIVFKAFGEYDTEKVKIKEDISDGMFRVQSISGVGSFGVFKDLLFKTEKEALNKATTKNQENSSNFKKSIKTKEDLIKTMYSYIEPVSEREVIKEKIEELLGINIKY